MSSEQAPITLEELLAEWEVMAEDSHGWTVRELARLWGVSRVRVHTLLAEAKERGRLVIGRKRIERLDGAMIWTPSYSITPPPAE